MMLGNSHLLEPKSKVTYNHLGNEYPAWNRQEFMVLAAIVGFGVLLRVACAVMVPSPLESDYLAYWTIANNFYAGHGLVGGDGQPTAFLSLGYPIFLSAMFTIVGSSIIVMKALNVGLGAFSIIWVYIIARRLFKYRFAAASAAFLLATYLEAILYTSYAAKENLMIFLLLAQFLLVATPGNARGWRLYNPVLFGISTGCLAVVGNAGLALLPALILQLFLTTRNSERRTWAYLAVAAVAGTLVILPLSYRNHIVFDTYALNNNGGFNLYVGNNPNATPYFQSIAQTPVGDQWQDLRTRLGEQGADLMLRNLAVQYILQHPRATFELALHKAVAFWWPPTHSGKYQEETATKAIRLCWLAQFLTICGLFIVSTACARSYGKSLCVMWLMVMAYTAVHMAFYVMSRYRLPIMPVLCISAGLGLQETLLWVKRHVTGRTQINIGPN